MNIFLFDDEEIIQFELPIKKIGNFWMKDSKEKNIINIVAQDNIWYMTPGKNCKLYDSNNESENLSLKPKTYYTLEIEDKKHLIYCDYLYDNTFKKYIVNDKTSIKFGKNSSNEITINDKNINDIHGTLLFDSGIWKLTLEENSICYINNKLIDKKETICDNCDLINLFGIKILLTNAYIFINDPLNSVTVKKLESIDLVVDESMSDEEIVNTDLYKEEDYFFKSPRIRKRITTYEMNIDSPPQKEKIPDTPLWVTLAPMLTMAASSMVTLTNSIMSVTSGEKTFTSIIPSLIICIAMLFTILVWPFVMKKLDKKNKIKREEERQVLYQKYINSKDKELAIEYENQKRALQENILSTDVCYDMITNKRRTLWSRRRDQEDFLNLRVGIGNVAFDSKINYHTEDFTMEEDNLKQMLEKLINFNKTIDNVPISYSFNDNILTCINGIYPKYITFVNNLLLQAMAFHSYDELKIVLFTNKKNKNRWKFLYDSPYCFSNNKSIRFIATDTEEMQEVSNYLDQIFNYRTIMVKEPEKQDSFKYNNEHYFIIIDDIDNARKMNIINSIIEEKKQFGFNLVILEEKLSKVPSEVEKMIIIGDKTSSILNTFNNNQTKFIEETKDTYDMNLCTKILSNIPIHFETIDRQLPSSLSFLELFGVGNIEQLNVLNRWKENNPTKSLKAEVGLNAVGDPFYIDLHEKQHGPHGLIAGMTGSGKSEFIITYVLSMAINYSPEEVAFVLIDYKGGGLSGAFVNNETGDKLPHVVGTITNLDKTEINRALASIKSELKRRQEIFNEVRNKTGEGTIDIYKYQRFYRDGIISEPLPHLIIVSDEFAELKQQQPDFMDDLVSTARIGRSLGVHLILATQKPSGVVDGQIWSNSKFKICLKVQDKQDSMEMIKNDLAAEIKNVGRFYLLVGYNEFFAMGQSAWTGAQYFPSDEYKKFIDKNLYFIGTTGSVEKTLNNILINKDKEESKGEELTNIVKYLIDMKSNINTQIRQLWLDKVPQTIYIDSLEKKYNYIKKDYYLNPAIGEYDDPSNQVQGLLTIDLEKDGNTLIYGMNESGKDELLQVLTYSLLRHHSSDELNMYILDFGAETLKNFENAPQVGNVVINGEDEKINNFYKLLSSELVKRKKLFSNYGGSYRNYIENSKEKIPQIVVEINSIELLFELYPNTVDNMCSIIRDGSKYGIYFIITTETQTSVKIKVVQSCKNLMCLQLNNEMSYRDILGKTNGLVPSQCIGRGLTKLDKVCEFQTAYISNDKNSFNSIKTFIDELNTKGYKKAQSIKIMPDIIEINSFKEIFRNLSMTPIGINKENLNVTLYNFKKKCTSIISSNELNNLKNFIHNLLYEFSLNKNINTIVIDANRFYNKFDLDTNYSNDGFDKIIDNLTKFNNDMQELLNKNKGNKVETNKEQLVVILGFEKFYSKLSDEYKKMFQKILTDNKEEPYINFILVDLPSNFKKYEYDEWYKTNIDTNNGIWVGSGLSQQFLIKVLNQLNSLSNISNEFAVVVNNGIAVVIKTINEFKNDNVQ